MAFAGAPRIARCEQNVWSAFPKLFGVHVVPVHRFPYVVFFEPVDEATVRVLAVGV